MPGKKNSFSRF